MVKFRGTLNSGSSDPKPEGIWRIKFNGEDCTDPGHITSVQYNIEPNIINHRPSGSKLSPPTVNR